ncbi:MAG: hypothetical protein AAF466_13775, partial [Bacteroidota bacterium]
MNSVINRFLKKNESIVATEPLERDSRHEFLDFLISLGSRTSQLRQYRAQVEEFTFSRQELVADLQLLKMYLELEGYLLYKDPRYIGTSDKLRAMIQIEFPVIAQKEVFAPFYTNGKNRELALTRNFISYTLQQIKNNEQSKDHANRWLRFLSLKLQHQTELDLVSQINTIRELRENYHEMSNELVDAFGSEFAAELQGSCYRSFKEYYQ